MSVMLYKHPGKHKLHGDKFDYIVVEENDVESAIENGWYKSTSEAKSGTESVIAKAKEQGIKVDGRTSIEKLKEKVLGAENVVDEERDSQSSL